MNSTVTTSLPRDTDSGGAVQVLRTTEEVELVREAWKSLAFRPNADIDFYLLINRMRSNVVRPHVIVLEKEGSPQAMLIGRIERTVLECSIGYYSLMRPAVCALTVVYGGVLGDVTGNAAQQLVDALYQALRDGEADLVRLSGLAPDSELAVLARRRPPLLCRDLLVTPTPHWEILLPASLDAFLARFSPKQRSEMRRWGRLLEKSAGQVDCRLFRDVEDVETLCRDAESVACQTYQRGIGAGFIADDEHRGRLELAARQGWLRAYVLYAGGRPCAFEVGLLYRGTFFLEYTGYDPALARCRVGTQVIMRMIEDLCGLGVPRIDCGLGDAAYKQALGDRQWMECAVTMFAPTARASCINTARTLTLAAGRAGSAAVRGLRLEGRIKKWWRAFLRRKTEDVTGL